ncbi:MAG: protein kinase [Myxococcales bacterium]|nr:protein kinase [Myxococcales bacterium]
MDPSANDAAAMDARLLGRTLGESYRVLRRIGSGGMGQVYEAEHTVLGRRFALKVLDTERLTRRDATARFFAEARAASQIEHPNIVDVVNFVTDGPFIALVMERLRGESLAERLARGPLPTDDAVRVLEQLCDALAATHAAGILHRDLKPANVFLCEGSDGPHAKVLDFGISKLKPDRTAEQDAPAAGLTTTGQLLGTPRYLSPEQARGALELDERCDVYSAAVVLFEMLAGTPPFEGQNAFQLIWKHGNERAPRLSDRAPAVGTAFDAVLARALEKDPGARYPSMRALRDAVRAAVTVAEPHPGFHESDAPAATRPEAPAPPQRPRRASSRRVVALAGLAGSAALLVTLFASAGSIRGAVASHVTAPPTAGHAPGRSASPASTRRADRPTHPEVRSEDDTASAPGQVAADGLPPPPSRTTTGDRAPSEVQVEVSVTPAHARVSVDGAEAEPVEGPLTLPRQTAVTLTFSAPGYATEVRTLTPAEGLELQVTLSRRRGAAGRPSTSPIKQHF